MKLNEEEKRMVYQIESTNQGAALNEIYMTWRYTRSQATMPTTTESLSFFISFWEKTNQQNMLLLLFVQTYII